MSPSSEHDFCALFETSTLGWIGLRGTAQGATSLTFGHGSRAAAQRALGTTSFSAAHDEPEWLLAAEQSLRNFADGEPVDLSRIPLDLSNGTLFEERVRAQLARVGYGETITYGELAAAAGRPGAARAVGNIMARNPVPLVVACHRVVGAGGRLGGYSAPAGLAMKRTLLDLERQSTLIPVTSDG